jgi:hypothetical protein
MTTDLPQITDNIYYIMLYQVHLALIVIQTNNFSGDWFTPVVISRYFGFFRWLSPGTLVSSDGYLQVLWFPPVIIDKLYYIMLYQVHLALIVIQINNFSGDLH